MPGLLAKVMAVVNGILLVGIVGFLVITSGFGGQLAAQQVTAEFENAFPLVEGMHVRVDGAIAGTVGNLDVNDDGRAEVVMNLNEGIEDAGADASAAIVQQDTTGDSYVAYDPGGDPGTYGDPDAPGLDPAEREGRREMRALAEQPLAGERIVCDDAAAEHPRYDPETNPCPSTRVQPRLDDLMNAFDEPERAGVQAMLVELSRALENRGHDLNQAALELRPTLAATNQALAEVSRQNESLKSLIGSAEDLTGQIASRDRELVGMIDGLERTARVTAQESEPLDRGLERLDDTVVRARSTLAALTRAAVAGIPIGDQLSAGAPDFAEALRRLGPFLDDARVWLGDQRPTLELIQRLLRAAQPTLEVGKRRVITGAFDLIGATAELLDAVLGGEDAFPALFDDDSYGVGQGTLGKRGFGAVAVEPGNRPGYPAEHAVRNWLRVSAIINCEAFGQPNEPGCLLTAFPGLLNAMPSSAEQPGDRQPAGQRGGGPEPEAELGLYDPDELLPDLELPELELPELELPELDVGESLRDLESGIRRDRDRRGRGDRAALDGLFDLLGVR